MKKLLNISIPRIHTRLPVIVLSASLVLCGFLYAYFINSTVVKTVERTQIEEQITDLEARIAELESQYMAQTQEFSLEYAYARGFVEAPEPRFVHVDTAPVLTLRGQ